MSWMKTALMNVFADTIFDGTWKRWITSRELYKKRLHILIRASMHDETKQPLEEKEAKWSAESKSSDRTEWTLMNQPIEKFAQKYEYGKENWGNHFTQNKIQSTISKTGK